MKSSLRIIVGGLAGLYPVGGVAWDYLQYIIGLSRLGHDVYYHEDTWSWPYHPIEKQVTADGSYTAGFLADFFERYAPELSSKWHYFHLHETSFGMDRARFNEAARTADVFLNVSGACMFPDELSPQCVKVFLDTDPGYNQIMLSERFSWSDNVQRWCENVAAHDRHFTYAENIHGDDCIIPRLEFDWKTTRMPIVIDLWEPVARKDAPKDAPLTTVMTWNAFKGKLLYKGVEYKSKGTEFERLIDLPARVRTPLKVAVGGIGAPMDRLADYGWQVVDAPTASLTPGGYQDFIAASRGELSVAKHVYVAMRSGWFSCRSACYLAGKRPVIVQDTGFSKILPTGEGILTFMTSEEAAAAINRLESDFKLHSEAAIDMAHEYFESGKVLSRMIEDIQVAQSP
jgi:hypothetical protein